MIQEDINIYSVMSEFGVPTVILVFLGFIIIKLLPDFKAWMNASVAAKEKQIEQVAEFRQVAVQCAQAIEANTEQLAIARHSQEMVTQVLGKHMDESRDSLQRIEIALANVAKDNDKIITDMQIIKERTA